MPTTLNLFDRKNGLYLRDEDNVYFPVGSQDNLLWTPTNCVISIVSSDFLTNNRLVMKLSDHTYQVISARLTNYSLNLADNGHKISFNCKVKCVTGVYVTVSTVIDGNQTTSQGRTTQVLSGQYSAVHSEVIDVPDDNIVHTITIIISISGNESSSDVFITHTNLIYDLDFHQNPFVGMMRNYFPDFYWDIDGQQSAPSYPFYKLLDALSHAAGDSVLMRSRMYGFDNEEILNPDLQTDFWAKSVLTTPELASFEYGPWLSQFTGQPLKKNIQLKDGSFYFDNDAKIQEFIVWQLSGSKFGRAAGSKSALIDSVKQVLQRTKNGNPSTRSAVFTSKYQGNPFQIRIQTLENETVDAGVGESSYLVLAAAEFARPMGFMLFHNTVSVFFFTLDDESLGVIGSFQIQ